MNKVKLKGKIFWLFLFFGLIVSNKANAIEYGMIGGKPTNPDPKIENSESWFIYNLAPGESKDDTITVMNLYDATNEVLVYAADTTPSSSGGFALKQFAESKNEVGSWVKFYPDDVPLIFQNVFKKKDSQISKFCQLSREELQSEYEKHP